MNSSYSSFYKSLIRDEMTEYSNGTCYKAKFYFCVSIVVLFLLGLLFIITYVPGYIWCNAIINCQIKSDPYLAYIILSIGIDAGFLIIIGVTIIIIILSIRCVNFCCYSKYNDMESESYQSSIDIETNFVTSPINIPKQLK